jgi:hypothetical protein
MTHSSSPLKKGITMRKQLPSPAPRQAHLRVWLALTAVALIASFASSAQAATPIASAGPLSNGGTTASGTVGSGGQTDACLNQQHSGADPSSTQTTGAAQVNDRNCQASSNTAAGGGAAQTTATNSQTSGRSAAASRAGGSSAQSSQRTRSATVAAADAVGLHIAGIRYRTAGVQSSKRFTVLVTLRDARGRLVRGGIVTVSRLAGAQVTLSCRCAAFSNRLGQATLLVPVSRQMLGKRLLFRVGAQTPGAHASTFASLLLPGIGNR